MDKSIEGFYTKNPEENYIDHYDRDHGPRLDAMIVRWNLQSLDNQNILDVGGGLGFLGKRLPPSNRYFVIDGAELPQDKVMCKGLYLKKDLDYEKFSDSCFSEGLPLCDVAFCLETLEHLSNPYNTLAEMKKLVKIGGHIYISIPHVNVWHNYIYPGLMVNPEVFAQFLGQMALPIRDYWLWDKGWNAHHFKCENRPYNEKQMLFPKQESKFINATPIEMVNL